MKKIYTLVAAFMLSMGAFAQAPEKMSYQAVIRDVNQSLVANQPVGIQVSILKGSASGTVVYQETQTPSTNENGLVSMQIGTGSIISGDFSLIDWSSDIYFIKTETDPIGGTNYTISGTSQMLSVPYALYAKTSGNGAGPQGPAGADGTDGLSAYEIWVNAGNSGTEADFLNSLVGATGPQGPMGPAGADGLDGATGPQGPQGPAGADGLDGATGPQGPQGPAGADGTNGTDGLSAYEIWVNAGNSGAEADFLNSLVGATGPQGPMGPAGADGLDGATGPQGPAGPIAGSDKQINFNDGGNAGADAELVYDKTSNHMSIGTSTVNPNAALEVNSTTGAVLFPRMTTAQRDALTGEDGMVLFNTTAKKLQVFIGGGSYSEGNSVGVSFGYSDNTQGNTFQIANSAYVNTISVSIANPAGNPIIGTTVYTMKIYDSQGGSLLATSSNTFSAGPGGYTGGAFDFTSSNLLLEANTSYYFEVTSDNGSNFYLYASYSDNYTLGSMYVNGAFNATADIRFTITSSSVDEWVDLH